MRCLIAVLFFLSAICFTIAGVVWLHGFLKGV